MQHYYRLSEMENRLAGEAYALTNGGWVEGERIIFGKLRIPAGTSSKPHSHPNEQISLVLGGKVRVNVEGDERLLVPDDINYRPANAVHSAHVEKEEDFVFITAKDTAWGIQGNVATPEEAVRKGGAGAPRHYYALGEMEQRMAGEAYSPTRGAWVEGERLIFGKMTIPAGAKAEAHSHPNEQMVIVISGSFRMDIDGDVRTLVADDFAHIPPNAVHSGEVVGDEDYVFVTAKDTSWGIQGTPVKKD